MQLSDPAIIQDQARYQRLSKEFASIAKIQDKIGKLEKVEKERAELEHMLHDRKTDAQLIELATEELPQLKDACRRLREEIEDLLLAESGDAPKSVIVEIRAGTGGLEAGLFAADLFRMYARYAAERGYALETLDSHETENGGFKEIIFSLEGPQAYNRFRFESGVHRVQRVPLTESSGRIHTSACTVAVLPEPKEVDIQIDPRDLEIDVYRSSGPGGQSVNTTDSAVRITHLPSGVVVTCQDERSQLKNKAKALRILRARLFELKKEQQDQERSANRKKQVGTGDRSEKIRTYNFQERRVTDHRINLTLYELDQILDGALDKLFDALIQHDRQNRLKDLKL